jgi:transposase
MLLPEQVEIFVCAEPTDMRKGYCSLAGLAREVIEQEPTAGRLFVFHNRNMDSVKLLYWHYGGFAVWSKKMQEGRFHLPRMENGTIRLTRSALRMILEGSNFQNLEQRTA